MKDGITGYVCTTIRYLSHQLEYPCNVVQNMIFPQKQTPFVLTSPIVFASTIILGAIAISYNTGLIFNVLGFVYPIIYGLGLGNVSNNVVMSKYWTVFGLLYLADYTAGCIFSFIPFYNYIKLGLVYMLIRNNFEYSMMIYERIENYYNSLGVRNRMIKYFN